MTIRAKNRHRFTRAILEALFLILLAAAALPDAHARCGQSVSIE